MAKRKKLIGGLIVVDLDGYSGEGPELVSYEVTATGLRVTLRSALALALQIGNVTETNNIRVKIT